MKGFRTAKFSVDATLEPVEVVAIKPGIPKLGIQPTVVLRWNERTYKLRAGDQLTLTVGLEQTVG